MYSLQIETELARQVPFLKVGALLFEGVSGGPSPDGLVNLLHATAANAAAHIKLEEISSLPAIAGWRRVMKALGHDPTRYRVSSERLLRRAVKGEPLPSVNALVDVSNAWSVATGLPAGLYDADRLQGSTLSVGVGRTDEPYLTLAGANLEIEQKPVLRDEAGACGSPLTDSARTMTNEATSRCLLVAFVPPLYDGVELERHLDLAADWISRFAGGRLVQRVVTEG